MTTPKKSQLRRSSKSQSQTPSLSLSDVQTKTMLVDRRPTHGSKLATLLNNSKLPPLDRDRVELAIKRYDLWIKELTTSKLEGDALLKKYVDLLNEYKNYIDLELIFDSESDFLHRQAGQLKLNNTILEEFVPYLFDARIVKGLAKLEAATCGPQKSFTGLSFGSPLFPLQESIIPAYKDQDFVVAKIHNMVIFNENEDDDQFTLKFAVSHFATEIKTNLDKTMFTGISQSAVELKKAVPGARYVVLCEYLDMKPIASKLTSIDEIIVLRKAKRTNSNVRSHYSSSEGRKKSRVAYVERLDKVSFKLECFERFVWHLREAFPDAEESENVVLRRGYF